MTQVTIYSDGACRGNPGPGGWGTIIVYGDAEKVLSGGEAGTTNNRMELRGAIEGLAALKTPCQVRLISDSQYLVSAINQGWLKNWIRCGWRRSDGSPVINPDLWRELVEQLKIHDVTFEWIKGHAGHPYNERCDELATTEADRIAKEAAAHDDERREEIAARAEDKKSRLLAAQEAIKKIDRQIADLEAQKKALLASLREEELS